MLLIGLDAVNAVSWVANNERGRIGAIQRGDAAGQNSLYTSYTYDPPPEVLRPVDPGAPRFSGLTTRLGVDDR